MPERYEDAIYLRENQTGFRASATLVLSEAGLPLVEIDANANNKIQEGDIISHVLINDGVLNLFAAKELISNRDLKAPFPPQKLILNQSFLLN